MTFLLLPYSGLSRVSRGFKWILGTSPRMTIKNVCQRMTPTVSSYSCNLSFLSYSDKFSSSSYSCNFSFLSYSCLTRVSMDPRNKSEDDCSKCVFEDDCYQKNEYEDDFTLKSLFQAGSFISSSLRANFPLLSSLRGDNRGQSDLRIR